MLISCRFAVTARRGRASPRSDRGGRLRHRDELGEFPEVLGGGGEEKFILGPTWASQPQAVKGRIVKQGEVLLDSAVRVGRIEPFRSGDGALTVGVGLDQAGIDCESLAADLSFRHEAPHTLLEGVTQ